MLEETGTKCNIHAHACVSGKEIKYGVFPEHRKKKNTHTFDFKYIQCPPLILAPLINMTKGGCENKSALFILSLKKFTKFKLIIEVKQLKVGEKSHCEINAFSSSCWPWNINMGDMLVMSPIFTKGANISGGHCAVFYHSRVWGQFFSSFKRCIIIRTH